MTDPDLTVASVLADDLREWLLSTLRFPVLSVVAEDGSPSQSVMWFDIDPDEPDTILMNTKRGRAKERWLRRDPARQPVLRGRHALGRAQGAA